MTIESRTGPRADENPEEPIDGHGSEEKKSMKITIAFDFSVTATLDAAFGPTGSIARCGKAGERATGIADWVKSHEYDFTGANPTEVEMGAGDWRILKDALMLAALGDETVRPFAPFIGKMVLMIGQALEENA